MIYKGAQKVRESFSAIIDCLTLSWRTSRLYTCARLLLCLLPALLVLAETLLVKYILDILTGTFGQSSPRKYLVFLVIGLLIVNAGTSLMQKAQLYIQVTHDDMIYRELALHMMEKAGTADMEYFDNADYYDKLTSCTRDAPVLASLVWNTISAISALFSLLIAFMALGRMHYLYGALIICAAIPASVASAKYTKAIYSLSLEQINGERQKNYLQSLLLDKRFVQDLRLFNAYGMIREKYKQIWHKLFLDRRTINRKRSILTGLLECIPLLVIALISFDIAWQVLAGIATVGDYSLYTGLIAQMWSGVYTLSNASIQIYDNQLKVSNLRSLDKYQNHTFDMGTRALERIETISFEHVSFTYPGADRAALFDVSFRIGRNEKVALVGLNGSGKSTLIKLLLRLYNVDQGCIRVNGIDIQEYKLFDLHRNFSVYFQDAWNYCFNLRENVTIADIGKAACDQDVIQAIMDSDAGDILRHAPAGLDTFLTRLFDNRGLELSGGQHQKLALARTFYRRHSALILDEPSSSLDPEAEHSLFEQLKTLTAGKTVLFTSHRLTNVILADRIIVLESGKILEDGTHEELLSHGGRYAELYRYQQEHYQL